jgi:hypothetical protein
MTTRLTDRIDWRRPWLSMLQAAAVPVLQAPDWRQALNAAAASQRLRNHRDMPIHFVRQSDLPAGIAYEAFISATGGVPTRDNLHDFFNALVWLTFPRVKAQLNALQAAEIARSAPVPDSANPSSGSRGKLRDGATIFDENAALLITSDAGLVTALREHQWREVFITRRTTFGRDCEVCLFGHALMEKLVSPYKAITAHAWVVFVERTFFDMPAENQRCWIDDAVAMQLAGGLATSGFTPLPVLGVPGWWEPQDDAFYGDATVFRPKRGRALIHST